MSNTEPKTAPLQGHWLIVSDLDGTLLDHFDYSHAAVDRLLQQLEQTGVPVILNSSKNFSEMLELRRALHNRHPFIVENGSAIFIPADYFPAIPAAAVPQGDYLVIECGLPRKAIQQFLRRDADSHPAPYLTFTDAGIDELVQITGLARADAERAKNRLYSEPLFWRGSEQQRAEFIARAHRAGLRTLQGGRFLHLLGDTDKGAATKTLLAEYRHQCRREYQLLAAGDSPNDLDMLRVAEIALIVRSPAHPPPVLADHPRAIVSEQMGPAGWNQVISQLFCL